MDAVKSAIATATGTTSSSTTGTNQAGTFPGPKEFSINSQRGAVVGLQHKMATKPHPSLRQEGPNAFTTYKPAGKLIGKVALITGGDSGIGKAVTEVFAAEGADTAIIYLPEEEQDARDVQAECLKFGRQCFLCPQDIRDEAGVQRVIATIIQKYGRIDCLVNNASVMYDCPNITDLSSEQFSRTIDTNIKGTFYVTKAVVPHIPKGGNIIFSTSQVAFTGPNSLVDYAMTKAALLNMMKCLNKQLLSKGIRVNSVSPGPVISPLQEAAMDEKTLKEWHESPAPMGRIGQPSELAPAYVLLASADGSFISGENINVNGGTSC